MKRFTLLTFLCLVIAGCTSVLTPPPKQRLYDLGPDQAEILESAAIRPGSIVVRGPSWLAYSAMQYRLDYVQPPSRQLFTESTWVAQPTEMVQRVLVMAFGADQNMHGGCQLRVELDEFLQIFPSVAQSESLISVRAGLVALPGEPALARKRFEVRTPAAANAPSGVVAHQQGARQLAAEIAEWLQWLGETNGGLKRRCSWKESGQG